MHSRFIVCLIILFAACKSVLINACLFVCLIVCFCSVRVRFDRSFFVCLFIWLLLIFLCLFVKMLPLPLFVVQLLIVCFCSVQVRFAQCPSPGTLPTRRTVKNISRGADPPRGQVCHLLRDKDKDKDKGVLRPGLSSPERQKHFGTRSVVFWETMTMTKTKTFWGQVCHPLKYCVLLLGSQLSLFWARCCPEQLVDVLGLF